MTNNEVIEWQKAFKRTYKGIPKEVNEACDMAISALEEIQQYREIDTVEECKKSADIRKRVTEIVNSQLITGKNNYKEAYNCFWKIVRVIQDN